MKKHEQFPSMQDVFKRMCHKITVSFFLLKKCINLTISTFNLYVISIKLAQNTKQFRSWVLENFISVIHYLFGRRGILWA